MNEGDSRHRAVAATRIRERPDGRLVARPDRIAFWAFLLAVMAMVFAAASAHAGSGGATLTSSGSGGAATTRAKHGRDTRNLEPLSPPGHPRGPKTSDCESGGGPP